MAKNALDSLQDANSAALGLGERVTLEKNQLFIPNPINTMFQLKIHSHGMLHEREVFKVLPLSN